MHIDEISTHVINEKTKQNAMFTNKSKALRENREIVMFKNKN